MTYVTVNPPTFLSRGCDFEVLEGLLNDLSRDTYDGEGEVALCSHGFSFMGFHERNEVLKNDIAYLLFAFTLRGHALQWCVTLHIASIHSYDQMIRELSHSFYHYDRKELNKKVLQLRKEPDESLFQFWVRFHNLAFQIPKDEIDWKFINERFQYLLHISENPHIIE